MKNGYTRKMATYIFYTLLWTSPAERHSNTLASSQLGPMAPKPTPSKPGIQYVSSDPHQDISSSEPTWPFRVPAV